MILYMKELKINTPLGCALSTHILLWQILGKIQIGLMAVRENDMDMTGWLDYFITGLETQMIKVKECGAQVIRKG